jgi:hypothetical protein
VITDVLTGTPPDCNGLICQLSGLAPPPRRAALLALALGVAAPLLLLRSIERLNAFNYLGVGEWVGVGRIACCACMCVWGGRTPSYNQPNFGQPTVNAASSPQPTRPQPPP